MKRASLALVTVLTLGCAYELVHNGRVNAGKADEIQAKVQKVRQLRFTKPVPLLVESRDQAEREMRAELSREVSDEEFRVDGQTGSLIGLYPAGIDLKRATLDLLKSQVAGFYDPDGGRMILIKGAVSLGLWNSTTEFVAQRDVMGELLLGHELTHALQDQHFGLKQKLDALKNDDDRELALKSVAEGDAVLSGFGCVVGGMESVPTDSIVAQLSRLPQLLAAQAKAVPEGLRAPLAFQYSAGTRFVNEAFKRGGWSAVDALYKQPPQSTQQIIHPGLYFDRPTPPDKITIGGYQPVLTGWNKAAETTQGELMLHVILKQAFGDGARQVSLAETWVGDRILSLNKGSELSVIWLIELHDERAASQFAAAYTTALERRLEDSVAHRVDYQSAMVLVVIGEAARSFPQLAPRVFADSQVSKLPAPVPPAPRPVTAGL